VVVVVVVEPSRAAPCHAIVVVVVDAAFIALGTS